MNLSKKITQITGKNTLKFIVLIALGVLQAGLSVLFALTVKNVINSAVKNLNELIVSGIISVAVVLLAFLCGVLYKILTDKFVAELDVKLKKYLFNSYIENDYLKLSKIGAGDLTNRISTDTSFLANAYITCLPNFISQAVKLIGVIVALFILDAYFTLGLMVIGAIILIITFLLRKISLKLYKNSKTAEDKLIGYTNETVLNSLAVKTFDNESKVEEVNQNNLNGYLKSLKKRKYFTSVTGLSISFGFTFFYVITAIWGVYSMLNGKTFIDYGVITAMLQLIMQIRAPISTLGSSFTVYAEMQASLTRILEMVGEKTNKTKTATNFKGLSVKNLTFSYDGNVVLDNVSLDINAGDKIIIKGESGIGKSTLLKIIGGVYSDFKGVVTANINGENFNTCDIKNLFSLYPQGSMLFSGTVQENLTFAGKVDNLDDFIEKYCLQDVILSVENKNGYIGQMGSELSEGQKQRVAILRAVISSRPIMLLDEPTGALDLQLEEKILKELFSIKDLTIIMVTHKNLAENYASKVYAIKKGRLV